MMSMENIYRNEVFRRGIGRDSRIIFLKKFMDKFLYPQKRKKPIYINNNNRNLFSLTIVTWKS